MNTKSVQLTRSGLEELRQELSQLVQQKRPLAIERVARARDFGDLAENAEYHSAREDLSFVEGRIEELEELLKKAQIIGNSKNRKTVGLGCKVTVQVNGKTQVFDLVGEWEADPLQQKISAQSPLGKALVGKRVGERVEFEAPAGKVVYTIKKIH